MYGINVVDFSPFLSYAMFWWGNCIFAITVTKPSWHVKTFGLWDFLLKKVLLQDFCINHWQLMHTSVICDKAQFPSILPGFRGGGWVPILHNFFPTRETAPACTLTLAQCIMANTHLATLPHVWLQYPPQAIVAAHSLRVTACANIAQLLEIVLLVSTVCLSMVRASRSYILRRYKANICGHILLYA